MKLFQRIIATRAGAAFLLAVGSGTWSLDARLQARSSRTV
jgi:hypothetical protein